jgi:SAM-dependent methyltransferase
VALALLKRIVRPWSPSLYSRLARVWRAVRGHRGDEVNRGHRLIGAADVDTSLLMGWKDPAAARHQHETYAGLLKNMYAGHVREDFQVAAEALLLTGMKSPSVLEIGCGSGYYSAVLSHLTDVDIQYVGLDYSLSMVQLGHSCFPNIPFVTADASRLPARDKSVDIVWSGASLMHLFEWRVAVREMGRVARRWCVFRSVPVVSEGATLMLVKRAYGARVVEVLFQEAELLEVFSSAGLRPEHVLKDMPYSAGSAVKVPLRTNTYICRVDAR